MAHSLSDPTVSVIIPVHNGGNKFCKCLLSVKTLRTSPKEIIVVVNGDSDGSWKLVEEFDIQILRRTVSKGPAQTRNLGAHHAKGDILFFIDADVTIPFSIELGTIIPTSLLDQFLFSTEVEVVLLSACAHEDSNDDRICQTNNQNLL